MWFHSPPSSLTGSVTAFSKAAVLGLHNWRIIEVLILGFSQWRKSLLYFSKKALVYYWASSHYIAIVISGLNNEKKTKKIFFFPFSSYYLYTILLLPKALVFFTHSSTLTECFSQPKIINYIYLFILTNMLYINSSVTHGKNIYLITAQNTTYAVGPTQAMGIEYYFYWTGTLSTNPNTESENSSISILTTCVFLLEQHTV